MLVHEALRLRLMADATVSALIGEKIYPNIFVQSVPYPAVAIRLINKEPVRRLSRRGHSGLCRFQFRFFSSCDLDAGGLDKAKAVDEAVRLCLEGFQGIITNPDSSPAETVTINAIFLRTSHDGWEDKSRTHQVITDYDVWAIEQQPEAA